MDRLAELAASIGDDPAETARQASEIATHARQAADWDEFSRAQSILGRAWRMLGEIDLARLVLDEALSAAQRIGDDDLEADAHLALAGVLSISGQWPAAFAHLDDVERIGSDDLRSKAELQRAALCWDAGRVDDALRLFTQAVPRLRHEHRTLDLARVLANRGGIRVGRGELAQAIKDLEEAEPLYRSAGQEFAALQTRHDLGCAFANSGDLPRALRMFDEVVTRFGELGHDASVPLLSRAEALLAGGLSADALVLSVDAARRLHAEGNRFAAAQALVAVAEAARLEGEHGTALDAASRARDWFASSGSSGWHRAAELEALRAECELGDVGESVLDRLDELAAAFTVIGDLRSEVQARSLAATTACALGHLDRAEAQAELAGRAAGRSKMLQARLASLHATATVRIERGDLRGARRELHKTLSVLETSRLLRGAGDVGTAVVTQAASIMSLVGRMSSVETQPRRALEWMEHARLAGWTLRPALAPGDRAAAADFARLRTVAGDLRRAELAGEPTEELRSRQSSLERSMRDDWLKVKQPSMNESALPKLSELAGVIGDAQIVSIATTGVEFVGIVASRRRITRFLVGDAAQVRTNARRAAGALNKLSGTTLSPTVAAAHRRSLAAAVAALDAGLLAPAALAAPHVVLVVPAELHAIPWAAMPSLHGRSFALAPSVRWWINAVSSPPTPPTSALVVAGPRLTEAEAEARGVAACHQRAKVLAGVQATVAKVGRAMVSHDLVHIVAHGKFRHDNPLWSTIELADGQLTVYELERLGRVPATMVLATCDSGVAGARGGAQLHGLAGTLLTMGARTVVAAIGVLPDTVETRNTMVTLHRDLVNGVSASASLARQRAAFGAPSSLTAASLVTLGVG